MTMGVIFPKPGINKQLTQSLNREGWSLCNNIRWKDGLPQKIGGWARISDDTIVGLGRGAHAWADLSGNPFLIIGTPERVHLYDGGALYDITPVRATVNIAVDFSTVIGTPTVTIKDLAHAAAEDDWIYIATQISVGGLVLYGYYQVASVVDVDNYTITAPSNATATVNNGGAVATFDTTNTFATVVVTLANHGLAFGDLYVVEVPVTVGGITLSGTYIVTTVTDANHFVITHSVVATSTATAQQNGGNVEIVYLLASGLTSAAYGSGYGAGNYGAGDYGTGTGMGALSPLREWFFDSWGEDAIGNPTGGALYIWIPPLSANPRMTVISAAPSMNTASFVSMPQQIAVALGCEVLGIRDPNLLRWCAVADYTDWTATSTNQAGSYRIPSGSRIVGGIQAPQQGLIWTDINLWSMRYIQPPFVFGFTKIADGCGLIAARAAASAGDETYWMGPAGFFKLGANGVEPVHCSVWDVVFRNLSTIQAGKINVAVNSDFHEITWRFQSADGSDVDTYVKMSTKEKDEAGNPLWDYGTTTETCWEDRSVFGPPVGTDADGLIQQHEISPDADGAAMDSYVESGFRDIADGQEAQFIDEMIPDFVVDPGSVMQITIRRRKTPNSPSKTYGPFRVTEKTRYIRPRVRGRQVSYRFGSSDLGSFWRFGLIRYRSSPDGRGD